MEEKLPEKLWLIYGARPARKLGEWPYSTDPRDYALSDQEPMSDEEYAKVASQVKVFLVADHAIDFCYECGFEFTVIRGYRLMDGTYTHDEEVTDEVLDSPW